MRYPPDHKDATRTRILEAAARQFRLKGIGDTSVAAVMKEAELTHGGVYAHFESKDDLVGGVIRDGFDHASDRFESRFAGLQGEAWLRAWVQGYLSEGHLEHPEIGCPLPSMSAEIGRAGDEVRSAFTRLFTDRIAAVSVHVDAPKPEAERRVTAALSQMGGAMLLARAVDAPLAERLRHAAAEEAFATLRGCTDIKETTCEEGLER